MSVIPQNLLKYFKWKKQEKGRSIKEIETNPDLQECLELIEEAAAILTKIFLNEHQNQDEETLSIIALRLSNDFTVACDLILSGWWYVDIMIKRDIYESFLLLYYLADDKSRIERWKKATRKQRLGEFGAGRLWSELKKRMKNEVGDLKELEAVNKRYWLYCEWGSHPTYKGICETSYKDGALREWCFFDKNRLPGYLKELVTLSGLALDAFVKAYGEKNLPQDIQIDFNSRLEKGLEWSKRNPGKSYCEWDSDC